MAGYEERAETAGPLAMLADHLGELVQLLVTEGERSLPPERIVSVAQHLMPTRAHVALTSVHDGHVVTEAASDWTCERVDAIQADMQQGPAFEPLVTNDYINVDDVAATSAWPRFVSELTTFTNYRSILTYRIYLSRRHRAGLTFYSTWPHAFDEVAVATGAIFAAYCTLSAISRLLEDEIHPRRAMETHREIGIALGILMAREQLSSDQALGRLAEASHHLHRRLADVATHLARTGTLPPPR
jgi:hypothetical protein